MITAEKIVRGWAERPNTYVIAFFACCRQLYDEESCARSGLDAKEFQQPNEESKQESKSETLAKQVDEKKKDSPKI